MSYSAIISVKEIESDKICDFFQRLKEEVKINIDKVIEDNYYFSPMMNLCNTTVTKELENDTRYWATRIFTYRWFFKILPNGQGILAVFGVPNCVHHMFDATYHFQNSTDQNYEFDYWKGIKYFEEIAEKWKAMPFDEFDEHYKKRYLSSFLEDNNDSDNYSSKEEYYRKSLCYSEIWNNYFVKHLYDDHKSTYICLFREYDDLFIIKYFSKTCIERCIKYREENNLI